MITVYCFVNGNDGRDNFFAEAVCGECGYSIGSHLSSNTAWAKHDIGATSEWHHDGYNAHMAEFHGGAEYRTEWLDDPNACQSLTDAVDRARQMQEQ